MTRGIPSAWYFLLQGQQISQKDTITLDEKRSESCNHVSMTKTYAEKVTITDEVPGKGPLFEATGSEKIEDIVICTHFISGQRYCPPVI